jgi:hypothetical protein
MATNSKIIKKIIIIFFSVILVIFLALLTAPFLFKNQIMELAKTELNKILIAKVDFKDLKLSFIRNFPNAYVALEGLEITGIGDFENELLVAFDSFSITADIMSIIKMKDIEIKSVLLDRARLNGHILEDGRANWEIVKPVEEREEAPKTEEKESAPFVFKVGINKFEIRNMEINFLDELNKMTASVQDLNYTLSGDMTQDNADLKMELGIDGINFWMGGVRLLNEAAVGFISEIAADLKNMDFIIKDNKFNLNDIVLKFDGSAGIKEDDINVDITFATERTDFKSLLSLVPVVYMNDFKDLRTTGNLALNGNIKGTLNEKTMPSANVDLSVNNAMFSYPDLPKSVEKINIAVNARYDGEVFDRSTVDVERFNFEMAGNPFNVQLHVKTPESDMQVAARLAGKIDFDSMADIIPLDNITLNGLLECDISLAGRMSTLEAERYEDFEAAGNLILSKFNFESPDFPQDVKITSTQLNFTPRIVELKNFDAVIGMTDIAMSGSLENFIPFVFKNETVKGKLDLKSNIVNLNEFMGGEPAEQETTTEDSSQLSVIEVPKNIDFEMNVDIGKIFFDKLVISNTAGLLFVRDGMVVMRNLDMNLLEGSMTLNGEYNTQNLATPFVDFGINIKQFDISSALASFSMLENILPESQNYTGKVSANLTLNSVLDEHLSPVLNMVASKGQLQTQNLELHNSKLFGTMADFLKNDKLRTPSLDILNIVYEIIDGRLWIKDPIAFNLAPAVIEILGDQGLDMSLNYRINAIMPPSVIGSAATNLLNRIPAGSSIKEIKITGLIKGNVKDPDISLSMADMADAVTDSLKEQMTGAVTGKTEEVSTQVNEEINRQIDQIMAEAQRQADNIRGTAKQSSDKVRNEANTAANNLVRSAAGKSLLERRVAETAAEKLRSEGEANALKIEQEGEKQAQAVIDAAQKRADEMRRN